MLKKILSIQNIGKFRSCRAMGDVDFSKRYHHNTNPGAADAEPINETELKAFAERAYRLVSAPPWVASS